MEIVRNETLEIRRGGKTVETQAELTGFEPSTSEYDEKKEKVKYRRKRNHETVVKWEKFLSRRALRILVVEVEDCTRQVVSALLRNCCYEVTAVADGLQAWELLEDPSNHFDLVLAEVVMPSLSGFGLLRKIMGHKTLKNIPVIMMSSFDSIGIVFKSLSKGAVDFLVKPIRKNELQNIWQHVWRSCRSSNDSGSGSPNQNAAHINRKVGFGNNTVCIGGNENIRSGLNTGEDSDNGSGTLGSRTNRDVEGERSNHRVKLDSRYYYDRTFAQVPQPNKEKIQDGLKQVAETSGKQDEKSCDKALGQEMGYAFPRQAPIYVECFPEESTLHDQVHKKKEACCPASFEKCEQLVPESVNTGDVPLTKAIDLNGTMSSKSKHTHMDREEQGSSKLNLDQRINFYHGKDTTLCNVNSLAELELTLHRPQAKRIESSKHKDKCMLRQSSASSFSRYNIGGIHFPLSWGGSFPGNVHPLSRKHEDPSCMSSDSPVNNPVSSHFTVLFEKAGSSKGTRGDDLDHYQLSQSTNNQDRCSSVIGPSGQDSLPSIRDEVRPAFPVPTTHMGLPMSIPHGIIFCNGVPSAYGPSFPPILYSYPGTPVWGSATTVKEERSAHDADEHEPHVLSPQAVHHNRLHHHHIQHHHHHLHHHHHEEHQNRLANQEEKTVGNLVTTVPLGSSCNMPRNTSDADFGECGSSNAHGSGGNVNGSASGSNNNGSNVQNGQSSNALTPGTHGINGTGNTVTSGIGSENEQNRLSQREAALTKFRLKRKERCFEKKVRYQSRKMLAEQRPRVRGQFVRRSMNESEVGGAK